jgi:chromatin segregation and condensation protein Rec8/ScpA/Scc1 (kleisin family)
VEAESSQQQQHMDEDHAASLSSNHLVSFCVDEEDELPNVVSEEHVRESIGLAEASLISHVAININHNSDTKFSKNTLKAVQILQSKLENSTESIGFNQITAGARRGDAAKFFFECLVLKTREFIDVEQTEPFGEIRIKPVRDNLYGLDLHL